MEREQIVKALECCSSSDGVSACESGCPYWCEDYDTCPCIEDPNFILKNALSLIKELTEENARLSFFNEQKAKSVIYEAINKYKKSIIDYYNNDSRYDRPQAHTLLIRLFALLDEKAKEMLEVENEN